MKNQARTRSVAGGALAATKRPNARGQGCEPPFFTKPQAHGWGRTSSCRVGIARNSARQEPQLMCEVGDHFIRERDHACARRDPEGCIGLVLS